MQERKLTRKTLVILLGSLLALSFSVGTSFAQTDKLVVEDGLGTPVFSVDDTGKVTATQGGFGTSTPVAALHVTADTINPARGILSAQHNDGAQAAYVQFMKSRGTEATPAQVNIGDYIGFFDTQVYSGSSYVNTAGFGFVVDNTVTATDVPTAATFFTGSRIGAGGRAERMRITSTGEVNIKNLAGTGNAYACINASGTIFRSATPCN